MTFVKLLESDKREGVHEGLNGIHDPRANDVLDAIRRLDGETYTVISLEGDDGSTRMTIGGGNNGFYNVFIAMDIDLEFHNLLNKNAMPDLQIMLVTGGQAGNFPATHCVDLIVTIQAAVAFFDSGKPATNLDWERIGASAVVNP